MSLTEVEDLFQRGLFSEKALPTSSIFRAVAYWCYVMQSKTSFLFDHGRGTM